VHVSHGGRRCGSLGLKVDFWELPEVPGATIEQRTRRPAPSFLPLVTLARSLAPVTTIAASYSFPRLCCAWHVPKVVDCDEVVGKLHHLLVLTKAV
jgi:hypothetical protein